MSARFPGCFVAGTDTGVGKTLVATAIVRTLAARGRKVAAMKPVAAGAAVTPQGLRNADALALAAAANVRADYDTINPFCFPAPVSPHIAAAECGAAIEIATIRAAFARLAAGADCIVVEGAGGWLAPIDSGRTMEDVAAALRLPVVLVIGLKLGCLNHAALTARAVAASGLRLCGWIGNRIDPCFERLDQNLATLAAILGSQPLEVVPFVPGASPAFEPESAAAGRLAAVLGCA